MIYVGIDLGGMSAKAGVFKDGKRIFKERIATNPSDGAAGVAKKLAFLAQSVTEQAGFSFEEVAAIGIGAPGVIDSENGTVVKWGNYNWINIPLGAMVAEDTKKNVYLTNDANAAALGEAKFGVGCNYTSCILITLGTGVGGGIVIDGKLFEGFRSAGAEVGHTVVEFNGRKCGCGRKGCFEQYSSATALIRDTKAAMRKNPESVMWQLVSDDIEKVSGCTVFEGVKRHDATAQKVLDEYVFYLGEGIANLVNIFRPQAVMLGGGVSNADDALLIPVREYVQKNIYVDTDYAPLQILRAKLGNDAGIYGAYAYALQRQGKNL